MGVRSKKVEEGGWEKSSLEIRRSFELVRILMVVNSQWLACYLMQQN